MRAQRFIGADPYTLDISNYSNLHIRQHLTKGRSICPSMEPFIERFSRLHPRMYNS